MSKVRLAGLWIAAAGFIGAGVMHFVHRAFFERIVPPGLPWPAALVAISGIAEIAGGVGLLLPATRRWASWGLIALLVAVFPANIYMAVYAERFTDVASPLALWARLPFQPLMAAWIGWAGILRPRAIENEARREPKLFHVEQFSEALAWPGVGRISALRARAHAAQQVARRPARRATKTFRS